MSAAAIPMSPLMGCTNEAAQFGHAFSKGCWRQCCYFEGFSFCSEPPVEAQPLASCFMLLRSTSMCRPCSLALVSKISNDYEYFQLPTR